MKDTVSIIDAELTRLDAALEREGAAKRLHALERLGGWTRPTADAIEAAIAAAEIQLEARQVAREKLQNAVRALREARDALAELEALPPLRVRVVPPAVLAELRGKAHRLDVALACLVNEGRA